MQAAGKADLRGAEAAAIAGTLVAALSPSHCKGLCETARIGVDSGTDVYQAIAFGLNMHVVSQAKGVT